MLYNLFLGVLTILVLVIIAGPEVIMVRQLSEFSFHFMIALCIIGLAFLFTKYDRLTLIFFGLAGVLGVFIKNNNYEEFIDAKDNLKDKISIAHINLSNIQDEAAMLQLIQKSKLDVVSFQEFTPEWMGLLDELNHKFPYHTNVMRIDPYGKVIFSKYKILATDTLNKDVACDIGVMIEKDNSVFRIISTYVVPSLNIHSLETAKLQLHRLEDNINYQSEKVIVVGEFNMVLWSNELKKFKLDAQLSNSRKEVVPVTFKVPYDHMFYSKDLQCLQLRDLMVSGKDRIGLYGLYQLRSEKTKEQSYGAVFSGKRTI